MSVELEGEKKTIVRKRPRPAHQSYPTENAYRPGVRRYGRAERT